jgi:hypothetical protein
MTMQIITPYFRPVFLVLILFISCTKNKIESDISVASQTADLSIKKIKNTINIADTEKTKQLKSIAYALRFSASIEREVLKTIRPQLSLSMTQFEVLSTILDQNLGIKKNFGAIDCKLYSIEQTSTNLQIFQQCLKPKTLLADIDFKHFNQKNIHFYTKEWGSIVGASVALTGKDRDCSVTTGSVAGSDERVKRLSCENTNYLIDAEQIQELRLSVFIFDQSANDQVQIQGGFYKNLVEHRQLKLNIPFDGKIKIIEKEIKVQDDFAEKPTQSYIINKEEPHGKKEQSQSENADPKENNNESQVESQTEQQSENGKESFKTESQQKENSQSTESQGVENVGR